MVAHNAVTFYHICSSLWNFDFPSPKKSGRCEERKRARFVLNPFDILEKKKYRQNGISKDSYQKVRQSTYIKEDS